MYDKVTFFNHWGAGDLFESREFVKDIINLVPAASYLYAHGKSNRMFFDISALEFHPLTGDMNPSTPFIKRGNDLYINTWIGQSGGRYVLPNTGCVLDKNYEMFSNLLGNAGCPGLSKPMLEYLPSIDFSKMGTSAVDRFISNNAGKKLILICNGTVFSEQAQNFDFTPIIYSIAGNHKDYTFVVTKALPVDEDNVVPTDTIIQTVDGFDLNDISYLAKFVDIIIGRKSGPATFAHNRDVWHSNKKSLSFTFAEHSSHFVRGNELPLQKYWSPQTDTHMVIRVIEDVLND